MAVEADILLFLRLCEGRGRRRVEERGREVGGKGGGEREGEGEGDRETEKEEGETRCCTDFSK